MDERQIQAEEILTRTKAAIKQKFDEPRPRFHLGASMIGRECRLDLWHSFRWSVKAEFDAETHLRFQDGHRSEDVMAGYLWDAGLGLYTHDPKGNQERVYAHGGHFAGSLDGLIKEGVPWHGNEKQRTVWEHKATNEKKFKKLQDLVKKYGDASPVHALREWDEVYYAQAQVYMMLTGHTFHYLTCSTPGCRDFTVVVTEYNRDYGEAMLRKAEGIVNAFSAPSRGFKDPTFYKAKFLDSYDLIYKEKTPEPNFRNSIYSSPIVDSKRTDAAWFDEWLNKEVSQSEQLITPQHHLFNPSFITFADPVEMEDSLTPRWVKYVTKDGHELFNVQKGMEGPTAFNSHEFVNIQPEYFADGNVAEVRNRWGSPDGIEQKLVSDDERKCHTNY